MNLRHWINERLAIDASSPQFEHLWNLVVLWNIFEAEVFECHFSVSKISSHVKSLNSGFLDSSYIWLQNRYLDPNTSKVNNRFNNLRFNKRYKKYVENILTSQSASADEKQKAAILVINRYRNNLFHGEKCLANISSYKDIFPFACVFLQERIKANDLTKNKQ